MKLPILLKLLVFGWGENVATITSAELYYDIDNTYVSVVDNPSIRLIAPQGGETLKEIATIRWTAHDTIDNNHLPISLYYSNDNGATWTPFTVNPLPNTGSYNWDTTALPDGTYMLEAATQNTYALFDSDTSKGFQIKNYVESPTNHEPLKPNKPTGQTNGKQGQEYTYSSSTN